MLKRLFCNHNLLTYVRVLTESEIEQSKQKRQSATILYRCNKCKKLVRR